MLAATVARHRASRPPMQQDIRSCTARDGVCIACATSGTGNPLVRYDERGTGLSDRDVDDVSFESRSAGRDPPVPDPELPDGLRSLIERCLHEAPEDRYARASELERVLSALTGPQAPGPTAREARSPESKSRSDL